MKPLQFIWRRVLLPLITGNVRQTLPGEVIMEAEKTSPLFGINLNDIVKGLLVASLAGGLGVIYDSVNAGSLSFEWETVKKAALLAGVGYLLKNLGTPSKQVLKMVALFMLLSVGAMCQSNLSVKSIQSWNADSVTVRNLAVLDTTQGRTSGWLYFNKQSKKWRVSVGYPGFPGAIVWNDLVNTTGFSLANGSGTTASGSSVNLGGSLNGDVNIDDDGTHNFTIGGDGFFTFDPLNISLRANHEVSLNGNDIASISGNGNSLQLSASNALLTSTTFQISSLAGTGTQMVTADVNGVLGKQAIPASTPAGSSTYIQYNTAGAFDATSGFTYSGTNVTPTLTFNGSGNSSILNGGGSSTSLLIGSASGTGGITNRLFGTGTFVWNKSSTNNYIQLSESANTWLIDAGNTTNTTTNLTIKASSSTTNGGNLLLNGGSATVAGGGNGGNVTITPGSKDGAGTGGYLILTNIPTSSAGLPSGAVWSNAGILSIIP
jgi:hypothetical protein